MRYPWEEPGASPLMKRLRDIQVAVIEMSLRYPTGRIEAWMQETIDDIATLEDRVRNLEGLAIVDETSAVRLIETREKVIVALTEENERLRRAGEAPGAVADQCSAVIMVNDTHVFSVNGPRDRFTYRVDRDGSTLVLTATLRLDDAAQEEPPKKEGQ